MNLPNPFAVQCETYQKLLILKVICEDKLILCIKRYVAETIGKLFTESPVFDLKGFFNNKAFFFKKKNIN